LYSNDVWALICRRHRTCRAPNSENHLHENRPKLRQLEKRLNRSNSAAREQIAFKFHKMVLHCTRKKCGMVQIHLKSNPIWRKTHNLLIYVPCIFGTAKARNFKFGVVSSRCQTVLSPVVTWLIDVGLGGQEQPDPYAWRGQSPSTYTFIYGLQLWEGGDFHVRNKFLPEDQTNVVVFSSE